MTKVRIIDVPDKQQFELYVKTSFFSGWRFKDLVSYTTFVQDDKVNALEKLMQKAKKIENPPKSKMVYETPNRIKGPS